MTTALLIIDVQQGLCEGEHATFEGNEYLMPRQAIWHHNATLANSSSFGPRGRLVARDALQIGACARSRP